MGSKIDKPWQELQMQFLDAIFGDVQDSLSETEIWQSTDIQYSDQLGYCTLRKPLKLEHMVQLSLAKGLRMSFSLTPTNQSEE